MTDWTQGFLSRRQPVVQGLVFGLVLFAIVGLLGLRASPTSSTSGSREDAVDLSRSVGRRKEPGVERRLLGCLARGRDLRDRGDRGAAARGGAAASAGRGSLAESPFRTAALAVTGPLATASDFLPPRQTLGVGDRALRREEASGERAIPGSSEPPEDPATGTTSRRRHASPRRTTAPEVRRRGRPRRFRRRQRLHHDHQTSSDHHHDHEASRSSRRRSRCGCWWSATRWWSLIGYGSA